MIAVKIYGENDRGIPAEWPKELRSPVDSLPAGFDFLVNNGEELGVYQQQHQAAFDAWESSQQQPDLQAFVPESVTPRQIRWALNASGLRAMVEGAIASSDQNTKDAWEFSNEVRRDNPLLTGLAAGLGMTKGQLDDLFIMADSFE